MTNFLRETTLATTLGNLKKRLYTLERRFAQGSYAPGDIKFSASPNTPVGYLRCDGQAVSRTTYADLFEAIGTTYGVGDGSTTFNVPDARRRALYASSIDAPVLAIGSHDGNTLVNRVISHRHGIQQEAAHSHNASGLTTNSVELNQLSNTATGGSANRLSGPSSHSHNVTGSTGNAGAHDHSGLTDANSSPYLAVNVYIKT